ncbi:MAG: tetratricopeptide repeat protein [Acidobacteria bacterium]|nr:tetratricopeptide repeat protein [Acidobacteriota bacterium]
MTAQELYKAGKLEDAIAALGTHLRDNPADAKSRIFLFELLCFAGQFDRADKQIDVLSQANQQTEMGALLYRAAIHAERNRIQLFEKKEYPNTKASREVRGKLNGKPFSLLTDGDSRIGANLEIHAAGAYMWLPFSVIAYVEIPPPKRLRDLLWLPALVRCSESYQGRELGEVLIPVLSPFAWKHSDPNVRLGRSTIWEDAGEDGAIPAGQKVLLADDEEVGLLEIRKLEFETASAAGEEG